MDVWFTYKLAEHYWPSIQQHFKSLFETDMKVTDILFKMEQNGLPIDLKYLNEYKGILEQQIETNKKKTFTEFGEEFDIDSPMVIAEALYKKMKFAVPKLTKKGANSTDDDALRQIDHPVVHGIRNHRSISHMLNTFVTPILEQGSTGVLHPDFSVTRTKTGRFSCSDPNAQNFDKSEELRRGFTVEPGEEMVFWDQSQIEMVGFAMYSKDPKMVEALKRGDDLHSVTAREVLGKEDITKEERAMGKGTNFAVIYGVGKARLAEYLTGYVGRKVEDLEAAIFKSKYLNAFPTVYQFQRQVMTTVQSYREPWGHFIKNKFGRVRRIDPQKAYTGVNHLIQGWAADLMKAAMVKIEEKFHPKWRQNIHDAIRIDVPISDSSSFTRDVNRLLCDFPDVGLPIKCTMESSKTNWAEVEVIK
jgi:DNA polymerase-1